MIGSLVWLYWRHHRALGVILLNSLNSLSPQDNTFNLLSKPLPFSHKRYFSIRFRQLLFRFRTNSPFLSCDSFAKASDYVAFGLSGKKRIYKYKLKRARIIFVKSHQLKDLIEGYGQNINAKVILTGNSDFNFTKPLSLPPSVQVAFVQNCGIQENSIFKVLPIGIENLRGGRSGLMKYHKNDVSHDVLDKVYIPPMAPTNEIRYRVVNQALSLPHVFDVDRRYKNERDYFHEVKKYKFVFCCEGNGFETHRIWESLYQDSFPVMLDSNWSRNLSSLGLPILIVNHVSEVNSVMLSNFLEKNKEFNSRKEEKLWIYYWKDLFETYY
jgi:hypothetical protein